MSRDMDLLERRLNGLASPPADEPPGDVSSPWRRGRRRRHTTQVGSGLVAAALVAMAVVVLPSAPESPSIDPAPPGPSITSQPSDDGSGATPTPTPVAVRPTTIPTRADTGAFESLPECSGPVDSLVGWAREATAGYGGLPDSASSVTVEAVASVAPVHRGPMPDGACRQVVQIGDGWAWHVEVGGQPVIRLAAAPSGPGGVLSHPSGDDFQQVRLASGQPFSGIIGSGGFEAVCCDDLVVVGTYDAEMVDLTPGDLTLDRIDDGDPGLTAPLLPARAPDGWARCSAWYFLPFGASSGQAIDLCDSEGVVARLVAVAPDQAPPVPEGTTPVSVHDGVTAPSWDDGGLARIQVQVPGALPQGVVQVQALDPGVDVRTLADLLASLPALDPALTDPRIGEGDLRGQVDEDWISERLQRLDAGHLSIDRFEGFEVMVPGPDGTSTPSPMPVPEGSASWMIEFIAGNVTWIGSIGYGPEVAGPATGPHTTTVVPLDPPGIDMIATAPDSNLRRATMVCGQVHFQLNAHRGPDEPPGIPYDTFLDLAARLVQDLDC